MTPRLSLCVGWITLFVVGTDLFMISPLLPAIGQEYDASAAVTGFSVTLFSVTYLLCAPLIGSFADRFGRRAVLVPCLLGFAAANWLTAIAPAFWWLLLSRIAAGAAAAGVAPLIYAAISEIAPPNRRATWMAVAVSGLLSALCLGAPLGSLAAASLGSRTPFLALAVLSLVLAVANRLAWPGDRRPLPDATQSRAVINAGALVAGVIPTVLWATALYGMYTYLGVALAAAGFSASQTARAVAAYGLAALAGALIGGRAADRFGTVQTMATSLFGLALGLALLGFSLATEWTALAVLMLASFLAQLFFPAQQARLADRFPDRRSTAMAWNNSALFLGISLGSLLGGQIVAIGGFVADTTSGMVVAVAAAAAAIATTPDRGSGLVAFATATIAKRLSRMPLERA